MVKLGCPRAFESASCGAGLFVAYLAAFLGSRTLHTGILVTWQDAKFTQNLKAWICWQGVEECGASIGVDPVCGNTAWMQVGLLRMETKKAIKGVVNDRPRFNTGQSLTRRRH